MYRGADTTITMPRFGEIEATKKLHDCDQKYGAKSLILAGKYTSCVWVLYGLDFFLNGAGTMV